MTLPVDVQVDPVRAWRWAVLERTKGPRLRGRHKSICLERDSDAWCIPFPFERDTCAGPVPNPDCSCGFYGVRDVGSLLDPTVVLPPWYGFLTQDGVVLEVEFSGRVIEYEHGYRAAHQRIVTCWVEPSDDRDPAALAEALGVPVEVARPGVRPDLDDFFAAWSKREVQAPNQIARLFHQAFQVSLSHQPG